VIVLMKQVGVLVGLMVVLAVLSGCAYKVPEDPNTVVRSLVFDGLTRTYRLHIPPGIENVSSPAVVFVLHGHGGDGEGMERSLTLGGWDTLANEHGFLVVYPDGVNKSWNDGRPLNETGSVDVDDVGFLCAVMDLVLEEFHGDAKRVFVTGISNGAFMSYRFAFDVPDRVAVIAPVAGAISTDILPENVSGAAVSVVALSGTKDPLVPWNGGVIGTEKNPRGTCISVPASVGFWVQRDGCENTSSGVWLSNTDVRDLCRVHLDVYGNGTNGTAVWLYEIRGGGHTWPGGYQYLPKMLIGRTCRDIDANQVIWDFFASHPKQ
jgi:polyhydroxybutyrate depolymerase